MSGASPSLFALSTSQCQQLIDLIKSQIRVAPSLTNSSSSSSSIDSASVASFSGTILTSSSSPLCVSSSWILDTGATHHVCCSLHYFTSYEYVSNSNITLPTSTLVHVTHVGTIQLRTSLTLHNVLFVPHFRFNLLSVITLTKLLNCTITFHSNSCFIQDLSQGMMIRTGSKIGNIYYLSLNTLSNCNAVCNFVTTADTTPLSVH